MLDRSSPADRLATGHRVSNVPHNLSSDQAFRLSCGALVDPIALRRSVLASCGPLLFDVLIVGEGRQDICLLAVVDEGVCRAWLGSQLPGAAPLSQHHLHPLVWDEIAQALQAFNEVQSAGAPRIARFAIMRDPPGRKFGDVIGNGAVGLRAAWRRHALQIDELYTRHG